MLDFGRDGRALRGSCGRLLRSVAPRLLLAAMAVGVAPAAAAAGGCNSPQARAFDFWIGDWRIEQKILRQDGSWLKEDAKTSVAPALDGCALVEHWEGTVQFFWEGMKQPEAMRGLSVRSYDAKSGNWSIYWMDTRSPRFGVPYVGRLEEGGGEFFREWQAPQGKRRGRITFTRAGPDEVHWDLAISKDDGKSWSTIWIMEMHRAGK
jgi:hypothetical protein